MSDFIYMLYLLELRNKIIILKKGGMIMEIIYIGNPFAIGEFDINSSCTSKTCGIHSCGTHECTTTYKCSDDTCNVDTESYDDEYWD